MTNSLIISTYNWPEALNVILQSILQQKQLPTEVLIADDGSTEDTKHLIQKYQALFPIPLIHVWHKDQGFRKTIILNKAIRQAKGEYIIQLDGDCICHPYFIQDHINFAKKGFFSQGSRVFLNENRSQKTLQSASYNIPFYTHGILNRLNALHIPFLQSFIGKPKFSISGIRGCNMGFWKKDFETINGYNEDIQGWGREDSEMAMRLLNAGILKRKIKFGAIQYHIHHPKLSRNRLDYNDQILQDAITHKKTSCLRGLKQLNA